ncbi:MAG: hypothetical protein EBZ48_09075 [Proteobacteria bacterium]|nr:hypothetical protein [Pseudomonadota bacterium]
MYLSQHTPEEFRSLDARIKELIAEIFAAIPATRTKIKIPAETSVFANPERQGKVFLIRDGVLSYTADRKILFHFEPGDLVGIEHLLTATTAEVFSDFAVVVDEYEGKTFLAALSQSPVLLKKWSELLTLHSSLFLTLSRTLMNPPPVGSPTILSFQPGEVIVAEGSESTDVIALVEGEAVASCKGTTAGEIAAGQFFGVLSALSNSPRQATVTAITECMVMLLPRDNFLHIIETKPATVLKMLQDMGEALISGDGPSLQLSFSKF